MDRVALEDLFAPIGPVTIKRMFGGHGVWADGLMFALQTGGEIFLKTDDETRPLFEQARLRPFIYRARGDERATSYWLLADAAHDDEAELRRWCKLAIEAARRVNAAKRPKSSARIPAAKRKPAAPRKAR